VPVNSVHNVFTVFNTFKNKQRLFSTSIILSAFINERVYCAVRTGSLNATDQVASLKG